MDNINITMTDFQRTMIQNALGTGFVTWSGLGLDLLEDGHARMSFRPSPEMLTPWGTLNGGLLNALVEIPAFMALVTRLEPDRLPVTNDLFLQHVRPLPGDVTYDLTGRILRKGKKMAWLDVVVSTDDVPCTYARLTKTLIAQG